jgi:hypothetical protein
VARSASPLALPHAVPSSHGQPQSLVVASRPFHKDCKSASTSCQFDFLMSKSIYYLQRSKDPYVRHGCSVIRERVSMVVPVLPNFLTLYTWFLDTTQPSSKHPSYLALWHDLE